MDISLYPSQKGDESLGAVPWPTGHIVTSRRSISKKEGDSLAITRREMRLETPRRAVPNYRHFTWKLLEKCGVMIVFPCYYHHPKEMNHGRNPTGLCKALSSVTPKQLET
jgi:hypothetical protein